MLGGAAVDSILHHVGVSGMDVPVHVDAYQSDIRVPVLVQHGVDRAIHARSTHHPVEGILVERDPVRTRCMRESMTGDQSGARFSGHELRQRLGAVGSARHQRGNRRGRDAGRRISAGALVDDEQGRRSAALRRGPHEFTIGRDRRKACEPADAARPDRLDRSQGAEGGKSRILAMRRNADGHRNAPQRR